MIHGSTVRLLLRSAGSKHRKVEVIQAGAPGRHPPFSGESSGRSDGRPGNRYRLHARHRSGSGGGRTRRLDCRAQPVVSRLAPLAPELRCVCFAFGLFLVLIVAVRACAGVRESCRPYGAEQRTTRSTRSGQREGRSGRLAGDRHIDKKTGKPCTVSGRAVCSSRRSRSARPGSAPASFRPRRGGLGRDVAVRLLYGGAHLADVGIGSTVICVIVARHPGLLAGISEAGSTSDHRAPSTSSRRSRWCCSRSRSAVRSDQRFPSLGDQHRRAQHLDTRHW